MLYHPREMRITIKGSEGSYYKVFIYTFLHYCVPTTYSYYFGYLKILKSTTLKNIRLFWDLEKTKSC